MNYSISPGLSFNTLLERVRIENEALFEALTRKIEIEENVSKDRAELKALTAMIRGQREELESISE